MPARTKPGEIWLVDLGLAAKVRPCLLLSEYPADDELALLVIVPHTTLVHGNRWEFPVALPFLRKGAFHPQQISLFRWHGWSEDLVSCQFRYFPKYVRLLLAF